MEGVGKSNEGEVSSAAFRQKFKKASALQVGHGIDAADLIHIKQQIPIRIVGGDQAAQRLLFLLGEFVSEFSRRLKTEGIIQKDLLDSDYVWRKLIDKVISVGRLRSDDPKHEFMLGHLRYVLVHPRGNATVDVRIAALQNQTDPHSMLLISV